MGGGKRKKRFGVTHRRTSKKEKSGFYWGTEKVRATARGGGDDNNFAKRGILGRKGVVWRSEKMGVQRTSASGGD